MKDTWLSIVAYGSFLSAASARGASLVIRERLQTIERNETRMEPFDSIPLFGCTILKKKLNQGERVARPASEERLCKTTPTGGASVGSSARLGNSDGQPL
jgi:hypothetical protein